MKTIKRIMMIMLLSLTLFSCEKDKVCKCDNLLEMYAYTDSVFYNGGPTYESKLVVVGEFVNDCGDHYVLKENVYINAVIGNNIYEPIYIEDRYYIYADYVYGDIYNNNIHYNYFDIGVPFNVNERICRN